MNDKTGKPLAIKAIETILTVVTVILIFFTVFLVFQFIDEYKRVAVSPYGESSFKYAVEDGKYARLTEYVKIAEPMGNPPASTRKYFGVGRYFYDSTMVALTGLIGDEELKAYWEDRKNMENATIDSTMTEHVQLIDRQLDRY
ncbi:MAG: hypothetical protein K6F54_02725 [Lachnospiraceae bacterium]|nr:hypothetical protein [Lachnospiraceae bacterium]